MSRSGPKNQVMFDGDKRNSIRTYNDNTNNRQGFKIGWDVDQSRKEDSKIAGKVGQDSRNSYIPTYQTHTYEAKQDDDYMKQLYQQELSKKQEVAYKAEPTYNQQPKAEPYYQDALDQYGNYPYAAQGNYQQDYNEYEAQQPQLLKQSNKYDIYQQPADEEQMYQKYKQGNSGSKQNSAKPPMQQYNPITGIAYNEASKNQAPTHQKTNPPYDQQSQQDDALSQFSQLQQHRITSIKNKNSNIFNTDIQETENMNGTRQNSRILNRKKEVDDAQYKGYGQFYKNPVEQVPTQYREQKFVNRNLVDNHIFPK